MEVLDRMSKWGYTLLEVLVVLALFALFSSIAIPSLSMISGIREKNELKEFRRDIIHARNMAVIENKAYYLVLDEEKNSYEIRNGTEKKNIIKKVEFKHGTRIKKGLDKNILFFTNSGRVSGGSKAIYLSNSKGETIELTFAIATGSVYFKII